MNVFGQQEETGENPHMYEKNVQTLHRNTPAKIKRRIFLQWGNRSNKPWRCAAQVHIIIKGEKNSSYVLSFFR